MLFAAPLPTLQEEADIKYLQLVGRQPLQAVQGSGQAFPCSESSASPYC